MEKMSIPKKVHFIWLGSNLSEKHFNVIRMFKHMNPTWQINIVNDINPKNPTHQDVKEMVELLKDKNGFFYNHVYGSTQENYYQSFKDTKNEERTFNARLSEGLRLYLTNKYGGVYLDFDMEFPNPIPDIVVNRQKFFTIVRDTDNESLKIKKDEFIIDHFFMGMAKGALDEMISKYNGGNVSIQDISNGGDYIEYSKQNYIRHLWERSYVKTPDEVGSTKKLQILITQYKEKKTVIKPLLDSIALQQGVDFNDIGVIIVNDGYPKSKLPDKFLKSYPFEVQYFMEQHRGVSGCRNSALDHSTAEYVMFCDADDMFFSMTGLNLMMAEMDKGFNSLTTNFWEEIVRDGKRLFTEHKNDKTFVHGKFYRRQYLIDYNIRFCDKLTVHEDSYFNMLATTLALDKTTLKTTDIPIYLWRWRDDSVCRHDPLYLQKTYINYIDSITELVEQLYSRNQVENANGLMCRQIFDTYYLMNTPKWLEQDNQEYRLATEKRFKEFYLKYEGKFKSLDEIYIMNISNQVRADKIKSGMGMEKQTFDQWIDYIIKL